MLTSVPCVASLKNLKPISRVLGTKTISPKKFSPLSVSLETSRPSPPFLFPSKPADHPALPQTGTGPPFLAENHFSPTDWHRISRPPSSPTDRHRTSRPPSSLIDWHWTTISGGNDFSPSSLTDLFLLFLNQIGRRSSIQTTLIVLYLFTSFPTVLFEIISVLIGWLMDYGVASAVVFFAF
ncbi:uncharacterized protein LOC133863416 [Alnus glutinosa]|uniref:uncharacterized protein LOC133863416 n=1 Tax=Alnus glutinosa TaxID=3517 RepID=UPI002D79F9A8|nr:uncharacterized protein LOC133863416 [Alnus glutinosa]